MNTEFFALGKSFTANSYYSWNQLEKTLEGKRLNAGDRREIRDRAKELEESGDSVPVWSFGARMSLNTIPWSDDSATVRLVYPTCCTRRRQSAQPESFNTFVRQTYCESLKNIFFPPRFIRLVFPFALFSTLLHDSPPTPVRQPRFPLFSYLVAASFSSFSFLH